MKVSYNWLREFIPFPHSPDELADLLTRLGLNVEEVIAIGTGWSNVIVGRVLECQPVPDTDHLSHCQVDVGTGETLPIVCGAPNVAAGQLVPVALVGAELPGGFKITARKLRGVQSQGMICSEKELGISEEAAGIMVLGDDCKIGKSLDHYFGGRDWIFDLEVTFNRPDCLSHLGVAREIAAATGQKVKLPSVELADSDVDTSEQVSVEILSPDRCPRYTARLMQGISIAPSPVWMQERLRNLGVRPISNVVDITNYVMLELGHPLHAFDYRLIQDGGIIVRNAADGESFTTLDDKEHKLSAADLLITDKSGGVALAGIMGGQNSEIRDDTRDVLLECAYFEPVGIRITSREHGISSESSRRFERGADPQMTPFAIDRATQLICELAGGKVAKGRVDAHPKPWKARSITLRPARANALLATNLESDAMQTMLVSLECKVKPAKDGSLTVEPPSWRHDLEREIDLVEEVARLHGYDNISASHTSRVPLEFDHSRERRRIVNDRIKRTLVGLGFHEAISPTLISGNTAELFKGENELLKVLNPLSEDLSHLRPNMLISLLAAARRNLNAGIPDLRLFEWGACFSLKDGMPNESQRLGLLMTGMIRPESWNDNTCLLSYHDVCGVISRFCRMNSLDNPEFKYYPIDTFLEEGARVSVVDAARRVEIGVFGRVKNEIANRFDADQPLWFAELDGDLLLTLSGSASQYQPLPRYPAAHRDLAFMVSAEVTAAELADALKSAGGAHLESVAVFDVYAGKNLPEGSKSLAYHLIFRSAERTLEDAEVDDAVKRMVTEASGKLNAVLRAS